MIWYFIGVNEKPVQNWVRMGPEPSASAWFLSQFWKRVHATLISALYVCCWLNIGNFANIQDIPLWPSVFAECTTSSVTSWLPLLHVSAAGGLLSHAWHVRFSWTPVGTVNEPSAQDTENQVGKAKRRDRQHNTLRPRKNWRTFCRRHFQMHFLEW